MEDRWGAAAALVDSSRRALYDYIRRQDHPVTREEAAGAVQISRRLAAFHLDKLVESGLLRAHYRPVPGQPRGRGRSPKVYEPAQESVAVTIPERRYELAAQILADALADAVADTPIDAAALARQHAWRHGRELGSRLHADGDERDLPAVLAGLGFEPHAAEQGRTVLRNCPFHALAVRHTSLICGLNHSFLAGLMAGLEADGVRPELSPSTGACCVQLIPDPPPTGAADPPTGVADPSTG